MTRLRDKFKKSRGRSNSLASNVDVMRMKEKYGHIKGSCLVAAGAGVPEPIVKIRRTLVIKQHSKLTILQFY